MRACNDICVYTVYTVYTHTVDRWQVLSIVWRRFIPQNGMMIPNVFLFHFLGGGMDQSAPRFSFFFNMAMSAMYSHVQRVKRLQFSVLQHMFVYLMVTRSCRIAS